MRSLLSFLFVVGAVLTAQAQWQWSETVQYGFIAPHSVLMQPLITHHSVGGSVRMLKRNTNHAYSKFYHNPYQGIDFTFIQTGNSRQLGNQYSLNFWNQFPVKRGGGKSKGIHKYVHLGIGIGYTTKKWDAQTNFQAPVLGSHLNACLSLGYEQRLFEWKEIQVNAGIRVTHFSNGAFQLPNLGTNTLALTLNVLPVYHAKAIKDSIEVLAIYRPLSAMKHYQMSIANGWKEVGQPGEAKHPIWTLSASYDFKHKNEKHGWALNADVMYNSALYVQMNNRDGVRPSSTEIVQLGVGPTFIQYFGNTQLRIENGFYVRDKWAETTPVYQRVTLRYAPKDRNFFVQFGLKTHFAKADHGEIGMGYRF